MNNIWFIVTLINLTELQAKFLRYPNSSGDNMAPALAAAVSGVGESEGENF